RQRADHRFRTRHFIARKRPFARRGTPAYMAPEQLHGAEVSFRSDLYSLGLVMYELFTGAAAFRQADGFDVLRIRSEPIKTPSEIATDIDPSIERIILHCLEEEPRNRPASA